MGFWSPDGVGKGSLLVVPFGRRDVTGVVVDLADRTDVPAEKLVGPRRVLDEALPADLVDLAAWMGREYCSTFARALQLVLPPAGARARTALWAERTYSLDLYPIAAGGWLRDLIRDRYGREGTSNP